MSLKQDIRQAEQSGLQYKIGICVDDFKREYHGYPDKLIANPVLYTLLKDHSLVVTAVHHTEAMTAHQLGDTYTGQNLRGTDTEIHTTKNLPPRVAKRVREMTEEKRLPLVLCRSGLLRKFRDIASYELDISTAKLTQTL